MPDREKVISGLQRCRLMNKLNCDKCPYDYNGRGNGKSECTAELAEDALELLKAQRETIDELISSDKALKLLEEQHEAVEPICQIIFDVPYYFCGSCKTMLNMYATKAKYCSQCGRQVKWEWTN